MSNFLKSGNIQVRTIGESQDGFLSLLDFLRNKDLAILTDEDWAEVKSDEKNLFMSRKTPLL